MLSNFHDIFVQLHVFDLNWNRVAKKVLSGWSVVEAVEQLALCSDFRSELTLVTSVNATRIPSRTKYGQCLIRISRLTNFSIHDSRNEILCRRHEANLFRFQLKIYGCFKCKWLLHERENICITRAETSRKTSSNWKSYRSCCWQRMWLNNNRTFKL